MSVETAHRTLDAVWRMESARLIAGLTRYVGDVALAEDLAQEALVAALEQWPRDGIPDNPGAWLTGVAKRRAIDLFRRNQRLTQKTEEIYRDLDSSNDDGTAEFDEVIEEVQDNLLRLSSPPAIPSSRWRRGWR